MSTPQEKFDKYDFDNDEKWKKFIETDLKGELPANPNPQVLNDVKKLWYKSEVDAEFDTGIDLNDEKFKQAQQKHQQEHQQQNEQQQPKGNPMKNASKFVVALFHIENLCKAIFLSSTVFFTRFSHYMAALICVLALLRQLKRPRWNRDYGAKFIKNEFTHNLFYMIPFSIFSHARNIVYFIPLMMHFWLGLCEYFNLQQGFFYNKLQKVVDKTRENKQKLLLQKSKFEIFMVLFNFILIFIMVSNLQQTTLLLVFYVNFLRLKYMVSVNLQVAFYDLNQWCTAKFANENSNKLSKWVYKKIQQFCIYLVNFDKKKKEMQQKQEQEQQKQKQEEEQKQQQQQQENQESEKDK